jgi:hypothetical protein
MLARMVGYARFNAATSSSLDRGLRTGVGAWVTTPAARVVLSASSSGHSWMRTSVGRMLSRYSSAVSRSAESSVCTACSAMRSGSAGNARPSTVNTCSSALLIGLQAGGAFLAEVILTFVFVLVVLLATRHATTAGFAGLAIGAGLLVVHLVGIPLTGTSVNPARSLGPALVVGGDALRQVWLFIVAPLVGGALAAACSRFLIASRPAATAGRVESVDSAARSSGAAANDGAPLASHPDA